MITISSRKPVTTNGTTLTTERPVKEKSRFAKGFYFFGLSMTAFLGIGMEIIQAYFIEPALFHVDASDWSNSYSTALKILHWTVICIIWGMFALYIMNDAKKNGTDLFTKTAKPRACQWMLIIAGVSICLVSSWIDWDGSKVLHELYKLAPLLFTFQYIYYFFEVALVILIIVFGQIALETWAGHKNIPYGGIIVGLTWGLGHWFTKGSLTAGIVTALGGLCFGSVYVLTNRNVKLTYILTCIMFIL